MAIGLYNEPAGAYLPSITLLTELHVTELSGFAIRLKEGES
jgi:hypothetical protein